jgi:putative endonuclease
MPTPEPHYIYLIQCNDDSVYTGYTTDLGRRIDEHRTASNKSAKYVRAKGFKNLLYSEKFTNKSEALQREWAIKQLSRNQKLALIKDN